MPDQNTIRDFSEWEERFAAFLADQTEESDAAHDRAHVQRVVATARRLASIEDARLEVVVPAAWLHDCVTVPKDDERRKEAASMAAVTAGEFLTTEGYPSHWIDPILHAIRAHSYSGSVTPETIEAKVVQDADRLDALGAVGIARCFLVSGALDHTLYDPSDPFCDHRPPDDDTYAIDHFYEKLLDLPETMKTTAGREEAERRVAFMQTYLEQLQREISRSSDGPDCDD